MTRPGAALNHRIARHDEPPDHALGRSRGGLTTKVHGASDGCCRTLAVHVTAGQTADTTQFAAVLAGIRVPRMGAGRPRTRPERVVADKAYSSRANRTLLRRRGIGHTKTAASLRGLEAFTKEPRPVPTSTAERRFTKAWSWDCTAATTISS